MDIEKLIKLIALVQQGILEVNNMIANHKAQEGKTDIEISEHAEKANKEARELIDRL